MMANGSGLLALPSELRNQIWNYIFESVDIYGPQHVEIFKQTGCEACRTIPLPTLVSWNSIFSILLTSKKIYEEARGMLYSTMHLHAPIGHSLEEVYSPSVPPFLGSRLQLLTLHIHSIDRSRVLGEDHIRQVLSGCPSIKELTLNLHMRPPAGYEHLMDAIWIASPLVRVFRERTPIKLHINFEYTYEDIMFDSPFLGEIRTGDAKPEHELVFRMLLHDEDFISAAFDPTDVDRRRATEALLHAARCYEQQWFERLRRRRMEMLAAEGAREQAETGSNTAPI